MVAIQSRPYRIVEFVSGGSAAGTTKFLVPIVNAPVVNEFALATEDGYFGGHFDFAEFDQRVLRILHGCDCITVFLQMLIDVRTGFGLVGIYQQHHCGAGILLAESFNGRSITIRYRTCLLYTSDAADEEE